MRLRLLSDDDVREAVPMSDAVEAVSDAFAQLSGYQADVPRPTPVSGDDGVWIVVPGRLRRSGAMGAKLVSDFGEGAGEDDSAPGSVMVMVDPSTGALRALLAADHLTALRTGAASGVATDLLALGDATVLTVFGAGTQARAQVAGVRAVRPVEEVRIVSRSRESAEALAEEIEGVRVRVLEDRTEALRGARIICTATTSAEPVFDGEDVEPGTHVNAVGSFTPTAREVDDALVGRARVVVDSMDAAMDEAGDIVVAIRRNVVSRAGLHGEIGEVVAGRLEGRRDDQQITFFKSVGNAVQDLGVARRVVEEAEASGLGTVVEL